jgi:hypothetical protein
MGEGINDIKCWNGSIDLTTLPGMAVALPRVLRSENVIIVQVVISVILSCLSIQIVKGCDPRSRFLVQDSIRLRWRVSTISVGNGSDRPNACSLGQPASDSKNASILTF